MKLKRPVETVVLTHGDPTNKHSFSGANFRLVGALGEMGILKGAFDVDLYGMKKYLAAVPSFSFSRMKWYQKYNKSSIVYNLRSKLATRKLLELSGQFNTVLQIGAMFSPDVTLVGSPPIFSYHDSNAWLSMAGGSYSFSSHVSKSLIRASIEREKAIYAKNKAMFVFSQFVKNSFVHHFSVDPEKIHVVYAGPNIEVADDIEKTYDSRDILFVGVDFERKGGEIVLEAFRSVKKEINDARLIIVGGKKIPEANGVCTLGFIDKNTPDGERRITELYRRSAVFVMPSYFEPFGIVLIEAMLNRTPCIGSNVGAIPEIITHGETGFVIEKGNAKELAMRIIELMKDTDLRQNMGEKGYLKAKSTFTWESVGKKMHDVMAKFDGSGSVSAR